MEVLVAHNIKFENIHTKYIKHILPAGVIPAADSLIDGWREKQFTGINYLYARL